MWRRREDYKMRRRDMREERGNKKMRREDGGKQNQRESQGIKKKGKEKRD